jgi:thiol:disulfide interchange protein DsbC
MTRRRVALALACALALAFAWPSVLNADGFMKTQDQHLDLASLPLAQAIVVEHGDGTRRLAVFEDPYCPFCRKLEHEMQSLDNVTIYVFLFPILTPQSKPMADAIWCAPDRRAAWHAWMSERRTPSVAPACGATPVADNLALAKRLGVRITPTLVFSDGTLVTGALPLDDLRNMLDGARP